MTGRTLAALALLLGVPAWAAEKNMKSGIAPVNGLQMYYEVHGTAAPNVPPLVLLHGGGDTITTSFGHVLPELSRNRQVIAFEQQGYGRTSDIADRPFSFEQSADDTAALLDFLHIRQADLLGFSNGGTIALQMAIRHPDRVRKIVVISGFFKRAGAIEGFWDGFAHVTLDNMPQELKDAYTAVAPHPENLIVMFRKSVDRMRSFKDISDEAIRSIKAPALVMAGDHDVIRPEHAVEEYRLLPQAQLLILPNTDHMAVMSRTTAIVSAVEAFLK